jgi:hypothetical protein
MTEYNNRGEKIETPTPSPVDDLFVLSVLPALFIPPAILWAYKRLRGAA